MMNTFDFIDPEIDRPYMEQNYQGEGDWVAREFAEKLQQQINELTAMVEELTVTNKHLLSSNDNLSTQLEVAGLKKRPAYLQSLNAIRLEVTEECAKLLENGRFLHAESPSAKLAKEAAAAIRNMARKYKEGE
jgi:non-ribosomal peptide synthetase component E (peptide arylation enzyme)